MTARDFFDDDLGRSDRAPRKAPGRTEGDSPPATESEQDLTRMARHKEELNSQVAQAMDELERLRTRQEDLQREKQELEDLRQAEQEYETGKRELISHLNQSLITLEKDEVEASRLEEMLRTTRARFKELLLEVEALDEDAWPDDNLRSELEKALARIERIRMEYNKGLSRIDSATVDVGHGSRGHEPLALGAGVKGAVGEWSFGTWCKIGWAFMLPLIVTVLIVVLLVYLHGAGYIE